MKTNYKGKEITNEKRQEYQNWLLELNVLNSRSAYEEMVSSVHFWLLDSDYAIIRQLQTYCEPHFYDTIKWDYVSVEDVREWLQDELEELEEDMNE